MVRVLIVCLGNICRSPMAHAIGARLAWSRQVEFQFDSAGTHAMVGNATDARAKALLKKRGYAMPRHRTRQIAAEDFDTFDLILALDRQNLAELQRLAPPEFLGKLHLLTDFAPGLAGQDVPDPYYSSLAGFERAFEMCEAAIRGLLFGPSPVKGP